MGENGCTPHSAQGALWPRARGGEDGTGRVCGRCGFAAAGGARGSSPRGPRHRRPPKKTLPGKFRDEPESRWGHCRPRRPAPCGVAPSLRCSAALLAGGLRPATQAHGGTQDPPPAPPQTPTHPPHPRGEPSAHPAPRKAALIDRADCAPSDRYLLHQGTHGHPSTDSGFSGCRGSATSPAGLEGPQGREGSCCGLWTPFLQIRSGRRRGKQEPEASCRWIEKRVGGWGAPGKERSPGCLILGCFISFNPLNNPSRQADIINPFCR